MLKEQGIEDAQLLQSKHQNLTVYSRVMNQKMAEYFKRNIKEISENNPLA